MGTWSNQERLRTAEQGKGMAPILPVVDKVAQPVLAAEPGQADGTLRVERLQPLGFAVQGHGRVEQLAFDDQP